MLLACSSLFAQQGKNGAKTINAASVVVNEYTPLTADALSGSTSIKANNSGLNTNSRFAGSLSQGDLVMIIQMQGASINGTATDSTWGAVTSYNNCGQYEFSEVSGVPDGTTIKLSCSLKNSYTAAGKVQVVRVPRYSTLTISANDSLTCDAWNGSTGGIVSTEVKGNTVINSGGAINTTAKGFRGGTLYSTGDDVLLFVKTYRSMNTDSGGMKGEGIAGFMTDYNVYGGMLCRGAAANAGGGGNDHNAGGGGGANAGALNGWTGNGTPDTSNKSWVAAWNLEYAGFAYSVSSGGGRGGYTNSQASDQDPLTVPPGDPRWGYDDRHSVGGKGGRPLDYTGGRIFFGGGGGAGHENNDVGGAGAAGGGLVYVVSYGTISGGGIVMANGGHGNNSVGPYGRDAAGGGGGAVILNSSGAITGITVYANGGDGGSQDVNTNEAEGAGGGGGGGYVAVSNGIIARYANGGANGTTNCYSFTAFPPNGATKGGKGLASEMITNLPLSGVNLTANQNICPNMNDTIRLAGATGIIHWQSSIDGNNFSNLQVNDSVLYVSQLAQTTYYRVYGPGSGGCNSDTSAAIKITIVSLPPAQLTAANAFICPNGNDTIRLTGATGVVHWQSSADGNNFSNLQVNDSVLYVSQLTQTTYYRAYRTNTDCGGDTATIKITVGPLPSPQLKTTDLFICPNTNDTIQVIGATGIIHWQSSTDGKSFSNLQAIGSVLYLSQLTQTTYYRAYGTGSSCGGDTSATAKITVGPLSPPQLSTTDSLICSNDSANICAINQYRSYLWSTGATTQCIDVSTAGDYWLTVTSGGNCSAVSGQQHISVYPIASITIIVNGDTLISYGLVSYQWFYNNSIIEGATAPVYIANHDGEYAVEVMDTSGCSVLSDYATVVTGVENIGGDNLLQVYPDPVTDMLIIKTDASSEINSVAIVDELGRKTAPDNINSTMHSNWIVTVSRLLKGVYYLRVTVGDKDYIRPIIKQ